VTPTPGLGNTEFRPSDTRSSERRTATLRRTGRPRGHAVPRGRWPSPARPRTARRAAISPAFCVRRAADDGQAAHGWPGQQRPIRPLAASLASSCPISSPWPAAAGGGSGRMSRPSGRRPLSCDQWFRWSYRLLFGVTEAAPLSRSCARTAPRPTLSLALTGKRPSSRAHRSRIGAEAPDMHRASSGQR